MQLFSYQQVDRFGRRILILGSAALVSISLAALGTFFLFPDRMGNKNKSIISFAVIKTEDQML